MHSVAPIGGFMRFFCKTTFGLLVSFLINIANCASIAVVCMGDASAMRPSSVCNRIVLVLRLGDRVIVQLPPEYSSTGDQWLMATVTVQAFR